jgi:hypothetical protein
LDRTTIYGVELPDASGGTEQDKIIPSAEGGRKRKDMKEHPILFKGEMVNEMEQTSVMRALSWNQPFGTLMLHGKTETRRKGTSVRGKVLICTCKEPYADNQVLGIAGDRQYARIKQAKDKFQDDPTWKLFGYAIGVADLTDCRLMYNSDQDDCFVEYRSRVVRDDIIAPALYCWIFSNVQRIEPFKWNFGKQGWGFVPESEKGKIKIF